MTPGLASRDLDGLVAVVTGSTSGIGRATAARLGRGGAAVVVNARSGDRVAAVVAELEADGVAAHGVVADVSDPAAAPALVAAAVERFGRLDVLVNNAGEGSVGPAVELPADEWSRVLTTNLSGPFFCAQAAGAVFLQQGSGVVVNVSSIFGQTGNVLRAAYVSAKHGLDGLTKALAVEWAPHGVRVCSVNPAYVLTPLVESAMARGGFVESDVLRRTPMRRLAHADEVADAVAFLASPAAGYITGVHLPVDGGWLAYGGL